MSIAIHVCQELIITNVGIVSVIHYNNGTIAS